jgi:hypothetical protein
MSVSHLVQVHYTDTEYLLLVGVTIARIYLTHKTREAFKNAFKYLWDTFALVTGHQVNFKFLHGKGLVGIMVDGSKEQANGCGDDLCERYHQLPVDHPARPTIDPAHIVEYIVKLCRVHIDR